MRAAQEEGLKQMADELPRLDKRRISVAKLGEESDEKSYWLSRTPGERWKAIEVCRRMVYGEARATSRLQRVIEVVELKKR